jgi:8-hydroxy-5-deazaflavin:NADPH oxidoreductase
MRRRTGLLGLVLGLAAALCASGSALADGLKIGIIGSGNIGGTLARHWVRAGHEVMISGLDADALKPLAAELGAHARIGTPREAAAFGTVVLIAVPYRALPQIGADYAAQLKGKVVIDTGNPYPQRDGAMADEARAKGTGVTSKAYLAGTRLVRAFNAIKWTDLRDASNRAGERAGIPIAGDDAAALRVASRLVRDAGFDPVIVGDLSQARRFDVDTSVYVNLMTAAQLKAALNLPN